MKYENFHKKVSAALNAEGVVVDREISDMIYDCWRDHWTLPSAITLLLRWFLNK